MYLTPADLRTEIINVLTTAGVTIGTYKRKPAGTEQAVRVGKTLPAGWTVTGLEVVIESTPRLIPKGRLCKTRITREWRVQLKRWDDPNPNTPIDHEIITKAVTAMLARWSGPRAPVILEPADDLLAQAFVYIQDFQDVTRT
jgi:hypothetical protein